MELRQLKRIAAVILVPLAMALSCNVAEATRIKDMASVSGVRDNQLIGYGL
ncbi:MAG TPA: flagellar biosynthesis protein FlgI, partial [Succinivibrionaceae bacterium]|nr:flagellar biosynthesis protein FlgI [Succinivibrionaceae bacterium]